MTLLVFFCFVTCVNLGFSSTESSLEAELKWLSVTHDSIFVSWNTNASEAMNWKVSCNGTNATLPYHMRYYVFENLAPSSEYLVEIAYNFSEPLRLNVTTSSNRNSVATNKVLISNCSNSSSVNSTHHCITAMNGYTNPVTAGQGYYLSSLESKAWWRGNFNELVWLKRIVLYNMHNNQIYLTDFVVMADKTQCNFYPKGQPNFMVKSFTCDEIASSITVEKLNTGYLQILELEAFSYDFASLPINAVTLSPASTNVTVKWEKSLFDGVTYLLNCGSGGPVVNTTETTASCYSLAPGQTYYMNLTLYKDGLYSSATSITAKTNILPPSNIEILINITTATSVTIKWQSSGVPGVVYDVTCGHRVVNAVSLTQATCNSLDAATSYLVSVTTRKSGYADATSEIKVAETLPSAPHFQSSNATSNSISVQLLNNSLYDYILFLLEDLETGNSSESITISLKFSASNLLPRRAYKLQAKLVWRNLHSLANVTNFTTKETQPSAPENVTLDPSNTTSVRMKWTPPSFTGGRIENYTVHCENKTTVLGCEEGCVPEIPLNNSDTSYIMNTPCHGVEYYLSVSASTGAGSGPKSEEVVFLSSDRKSSEVLSLKAHVKQNILLVTWKPPQNQKGVIFEYLVKVKYADKQCIFFNKCYDCKRSVEDMTMLGKTQYNSLSKNVSYKCSANLDLRHRFSSQDRNLSISVPFLPTTFSSHIIYNVTIYPINREGLGKAENITAKNDSPPQGLSQKDIRNYSLLGVFAFLFLFAITAFIVTIIMYRRRYSLCSKKDANESVKMRKVERETHNTYVDPNNIPPPVTALEQPTIIRPTVEQKAPRPAIQHPKPRIPPASPLLQPRLKAVDIPIPPTMNIQFPVRGDADEASSTGSMQEIYAENPGFQNDDEDDQEYLELK